jgi:hypothetical protein
MAIEKLRSKRAGLTDGRFGLGPLRRRMEGDHGSGSQRHAQRVVNGARSRCHQCRSRPTSPRGPLQEPSASYGPGERATRGGRGHRSGRAAERTRPGPGCVDTDGFAESNRSRAPETSAAGNRRGRLHRAREQTQGKAIVSCDSGRLTKSLSPGALDRGIGARQWRETLLCWRLAYVWSKLPDRPIPPMQMSELTKTPDSSRGTRTPPSTTRSESHLCRHQPTR